jgi:subtilisin family serine protease
MGRRSCARGVAAATCAFAVLALSGPASARAVNDPSLPRQWGLAKIGAPQAWDTATGAGTVIAVLDSGVDLTHEDLAGKLLTGKDYTGKGSVQDDCGHGSHVSGIAAASTNNGKGIAGVAPDARILPVKVLQLDGSDCVGNSDEIADAIKWAADQHATVINLSLGSDIQFLTGSGFGDSLSYAWSKGSIPVVAAGNQFLLGSGYTDEPAIIVTATTPTDTKPSYSSTTGGAKWAMSAPGGAGTGDDRDVLSAYFVEGKANQYGLLAGTSMATPHVAGAAAVLRSMGLSPQQTVDRLLATATDLGAKGTDTTFGAGRLDLAKAVGAPATSTPTVAGTTAPTTKAVGTNTTATSRRAGSVTVSGGGTATGSSAPAGDTSAITAPPPSPTAEGTGPPPTLSLAIEEPSDKPAQGDGGRPAGLVLLAGAGVLAAAAGAGWTVRSRRASGGA